MGSEVRSEVKDRDMSAVWAPGEESIHYQKQRYYAFPLAKSATLASFDREL
jgi:hypothetical protein